MLVKDKLMESFQMKDPPLSFTYHLQSVEDATHYLGQSGTGSSFTPLIAGPRTGSKSKQ